MLDGTFVAFLVLRGRLVEDDPPFPDRIHAWKNLALKSHCDGPQIDFDGASDSSHFLLALQPWS